MSGQEERKLVDRLYSNGWVIFIALLGASLICLPSEFSFGVLLGGLLVLGNLFLLRRFVFRALSSGRRVTPFGALPKFYLCFFLTCLIIFILIAQNMVSGLGLLLGLAVFIINVFFVVGHMAGKIIYKTITKEAV